ncbi:class I SAM-dependent methyltransferase [Adhaeretor mobilis]|uniref:Methyltransferase domain protein n=1 Tax=Adhaeretor mobilis TaxID=1930276 RepID=A0A517MZW2_9BACT|nr:methyltransferase domain-containing protein [Adhaeretor mobilis]QDT00421.1 Methyltransferase domain protein [Adhaeretor mobilis]
MPTIAPPTPTDELSPKVAAATKPNHVMLADGRLSDLNGLDRRQLHELQWEQEQKFTHAILAFPKGSQERVMIVGQAYNTICTILAAMQGDDEPLQMGMDKRYIKLVLDLLVQQYNRGSARPALFEVGYGCGSLLDEVRGQGYQIGGIEVSSTMRDQAVGVLGQRHEENLLLGDLRSVDTESLPFQPTVVYWNDVFEHIAPDEIKDYLQTIYGVLAPGGVLVTITPNWLLRPSDVTGDFCPARTEARGLHLKEYSLAEVTSLLKQTGFRRIGTPLASIPGKLIMCGGGGRWVKQRIEPMLDRLPVRLAHLLCRGFAMSITLAWK